jgi:hypothetical protein
MRRKIRIHLLIYFLLILSNCSNKINESNTAKEEGKEELVQGGMLVYEADGHGLIVATSDLEKEDWASAKTACDELELNGFNDWRLPTKEELDTLYTLLKLQGKGGFEDGSYWSSSEYNSYYAWRKNFKTGKIDRRGNKTKEQLVRAVRNY